MKKGTWKTKEGRILVVSEMETTHIENCIAMLKQVLKSKPPYQVYIGDSYYAERTVDEENHQNDMMEEEVLGHIDFFKKELEKRK